MPETTNPCAEIDVDPYMRASLQSPRSIMECTLGHQFHCKTGEVKLWEKLLCPEPGLGGQCMRPLRQVDLRVGKRVRVSDAIWEGTNQNRGWSYEGTVVAISKTDDILIEHPDGSWNLTDENTYGENFEWLDD